MWVIMDMDAWCYDLWKISSTIRSLVIPSLRDATIVYATGVRRFTQWIHWYVYTTLHMFISNDNRVRRHNKSLKINAHALYRLSFTLYTNLLCLEAHPNGKCHSTKCKVE